MKKIALLVSALCVMAIVLVGCGSSAASSSKSANPTGLADGAYTAVFDTDSTMFHANEVCEGGQCALTVKDGQATLHVPLAGTGYTKFFLGSADDAKKGKNVVEGTEETVKYSDGMTKKVIAFDIPVEKLDEEFAIAVYGPKKDLWYDHKVSVKNAQPAK